jgi:hypothetical protein
VKEWDMVVLKSMVIMVVVVREQATAGRDRMICPSMVIRKWTMEIRIRIRMIWK